MVTADLLIHSGRAATIVIYTDPFIWLLQSIFTNCSSLFLQAQHKERLTGVFSINSKMKKLNYIELKGILPEEYCIAEGQDRESVHPSFVTDKKGKNLSAYFWRLCTLWHPHNMEDHAAIILPSLHAASLMQRGEYTPHRSPHPNRELPSAIVSTSMASPDSI